MRYWQEVAAEGHRWYQGWRRRVLRLGIRCLGVYIVGLAATWASLALTGDWAPIALWGGLLLSNTGPLVFAYAFWMRETGIW